MNAIKEARRFIERNPEDPSARTLTSLVLALETDRSFELAALYKLDYKAFNLAMDVLRDWRLDRYYAGKAKLFDLSFQLNEMAEPKASAKAAARPVDKPVADLPPAAATASSS